jgi:hypothetical protein
MATRKSLIVRQKVDVMNGSSIGYKEKNWIRKEARSIPENENTDRREDTHRGCEGAWYSPGCHHIQEAGDHPGPFRRNPSQFFSER